MGKIGDPITESAPAVGSTGYAATINALLTEIKARVTAKVLTSSLDVADAALDMNNQAVQNAGSVGLYSQGSVAATPYGRLVRYNGNLYYVDTSGSVQITDGANLNRAGLGTIGGDYGVGNTAALNFVEGTSTFEFYENPTGPSWAIVKCGKVDIVGTAANVTSLDSQATTSYTISLPPDNPAANRSVLTVDSAGNMDHDQAITNDIVLSGSTKVQHGNRTLTIFAPASFIQVAGTAVVPAGTGLPTTSAAQFYIGIHGIPVGARIVSVSVYIRRSVTAGNAQAQLFGLTSAGVNTAIGVAASSAVTNADVTLTQAGINHTVLSTSGYNVWVSLPTSGDTLRIVTVTYDQPA